MTACMMGHCEVVSFQRRSVSSWGSSMIFARPMSASELVVWALEDVGPRALGFRDSLYQTTAPGALH